MLYPLYDCLKPLACALLSSKKKARLDKSNDREGSSSTG